MDNWGSRTAQGVFTTFSSRTTMNMGTKSTWPGMVMVPTITQKRKSRPGNSFFAKLKAAMESRSKIPAVAEMEMSRLLRNQRFIWVFLNSSR